jgi:hypothetical protein
VKPQDAVSAANRITRRESIQSGFLPRTNSAIDAVRLRLTASCGRGWDRRTRFDPRETEAAMRALRARTPSPPRTPGPAPPARPYRKSLGPGVRRDDEGVDAVFCGEGLHSRPIPCRSIAAEVALTTPTSRHSLPSPRQTPGPSAFAQPHESLWAHGLRRTTERWMRRSPVRSCRIDPRSGIHATYGSHPTTPPHHPKQVLQRRTHWTEE